MIRKIPSTMALIALLVSILTLAAFANDLPGGNVKSDLSQPKVPNTLDSARSLGEFLTPDGRFDLEAARRSGYQGSLDLKGFESALDPSTGQPVFRQLLLLRRLMIPMMSIGHRWHSRRVAGYLLPMLSVV